MCRPERPPSPPRAARALARREQRRSPPRSARYARSTSFDRLCARQQDEVRLAGEDNDIAVVVESEAFGRDVTERAVAVDRIVPFRRSIEDIDMGAVGVEFVPAILIELDIAVEIEQLRLGLVSPGITRELNPIAAVGGEVGLRPV